ncbi:hypothetical protein MED01_002386 [Micromonospora sp. MED01]|uniref:hypothetical protein n=1 Tax=Micromonospora alfalfae TaxID=2911212 RepID=UPI001EE92F46|nr:hypothetical protein [Micromonospora alfalfae]MCG5464221.1 hypothetical protein [Micromonospora alfalfae]
MPRARPNLGTAFGTDGPWLAAILDTLGDIADLLDARLPAPASADGGEPAPGGPVRISEPAPERRPDKTATPVSEPAADEPPTEDDDESVEVTEPAPDDRPSLPPPPPRRGKGSGLDAWQAFANVAKVKYPADASRNDIADACERAGVIPAS